MVYADSLTSVSADGFRFSGGDGRSSRVDSFRASIARVADLPCDVLMSPHPGFFGMEQKLLKRQADPETNPFIDPGACAGYAAAAQAALEARVAAEAGG
jgi:metallo-beta-lactamase class B